MYSKDDLKEIVCIRQSLKDKYSERRKLHSDWYHHGAYLRVRIAGWALCVPVLIESYFVSTVGYSLLISFPIAIWYWNHKSIIVKAIESEADKIRFYIVKIEVRLKKDYSLMYESYKEYLYDPREHNRFSIDKNEFIDDIKRDLTDREIDEDWL